MSLPEVIEIVPLDKPVQALITVPGSKSITNRALILAALAEGETVLHGALWSEDTQVMVEGLRTLGFEVNVADDPAEPCNRTVTVCGLGGRIPNAGTLEEPLQLFVGNAGTAARFLSALVCLGRGIYRLHGVKRMHQRPQAALFDALRELGYCIDSVNDLLPATIHGTGTREGTCCVSISDSSQFASALLLCAKVGKWHVNVVGENAEESPYVAMTMQLIERFPIRGGPFEIEPDASSGSYFWAAGWLLEGQGRGMGELCRSEREELARRLLDKSEGGASFDGHGGSVRVAKWPRSRWQIDADFLMFVPPPARISRAHDLGDSIMTAVMLAPFSQTSVRFLDLGRLRLQESERVAALRTELTKCGAKVVEEADSLTVYPSPLHGAEIETYHDHRVAMCFAILGLKVPGIKIKNPACVKKTFPNFFQKLAAPPPAGLGAPIRNAATGRRLGLDELFAV